MTSLEVQMMTRLSAFERQQIMVFRRRGLSVRETARQLGRDHSVVSRELRRNAGALGYAANRAQQYATRRATKTNLHILAKDPVLRAYVEARLADDWSPEQIAGRLRYHPPPELGGRTVSHESIYRYIYAEAPELYHRLRKAHPIRRPRRGRTPRTAPTPGKPSIWERPQVVSDRTEVGHWEGDTLEGRRRSAHHVSVHAERLSRYVRLSRLTDKAAQTTFDTYRHTLEALPPGSIQSLTLDNGPENARYRDLGLPTYFCDPYAAWQKGMVENTNGLIRQYFPKKTDFTTVTDDQLRFVQDRLNDRPRKCLRYATPSERLTTLSGALNS